MTGPPEPNPIVSATKVAHVTTTGRAEAVLPYTDVTACGPNEAAAWQERAADLAAYVWAHLVNRPDVWGGYLTPSRRPVKTRADGSQYTQKSVTAPPLHQRGVAVLTPARLARHFAGRDEGDLVGLHAIAPDNTVRWGAVDIDKHGDDGDAADNQRAALHWYRVLRRLGLAVWLTDSNGAGGFHLLIIFDGPTPAGRVYRFLKRLVRDHPRRGLPAVPETFPRQAALSAAVAFGNWLRLPGRHHTRPHWPRVWDGSRWLAEAEAVAFLLGTVPASPDLVPEIPPDEPSAPPEPKTQAVRATNQTAGNGPRPTDREVALRCLAAIPNRDVHYNEWVSTGMALHATDAGLLHAWDDWSRGSGKYTAGECARCWSHFSTAGRDRRYGLGTLVYRARRNGFEPFQRPEPRRRKAKVRAEQKPARRPPDFVRFSSDTPGDRSRMPAAAHAAGGRGEP